MTELESVPPIDRSKELQDKIKCLKALVMIQQVLEVGSYPLREHYAVMESVNFLRVLHKSVGDEVVAMPEAKSMPELKPLFVARYGQELDEELQKQIDEDRETEPCLKP